MQEIARAKLNLFLHVTGKRADGYHTLESLMVFADVGDVLNAVEGEGLTLTIDGPFAPALVYSADENLVIRAARLLQREAGITRGASLTLTKNLPVASGMGGGSADAAAALRLLARLWDVRIAEPDMSRLALMLGSDVPACLASESVFASGVGERLAPVPFGFCLPVLLVNPGVPVLTAHVFARLHEYRSALEPWPPAVDASSLPHALQRWHNDLEAPAMALAPVIAEILEELRAQAGCALARMSGSGATCFGVFENFAQARAAEVLLARPGRWVTPALIGEEHVHQTQ